MRVNLILLFVCYPVVRTMCTLIFSLITFDQRIQVTTRWSQAGGGEWCTKAGCYIPSSTINPTLTIGS